MITIIKQDTFSISNIKFKINLLLVNNEYKIIVEDKNNNLIYNDITSNEDIYDLLNNGTFNLTELFEYLFEGIKENIEGIYF